MSSFESYTINNQNCVIDEFQAEGDFWQVP